MRLSCVPVPRFSSSIFTLSTPSPPYPSTIRCRRSAPVFCYNSHRSNPTRTTHIQPPCPISRFAPLSRIPSRRTCPISSDRAPRRRRPPTRTPQRPSPLHPESIRYIWAFAPTASQIWPFLRWPKGPPLQQCPCHSECVTAQHRRQFPPTPKAKRPSYQHPAH